MNYLRLLTFGLVAGLAAALPVKNGKPDQLTFSHGVVQLHRADPRLPPLRTPANTVPLQSVHDLRDAGFLSSSPNDVLTRSLVQNLLQSVTNAYQEVINRQQSLLHAIYSNQGADSWQSFLSALTIIPNLGWTLQPTDDLTHLGRSGFFLSTTKIDGQLNGNAGHCWNPSEDSDVMEPETPELGERIADIPVKTPTTPIQPITELKPANIETPQAAKPVKIETPQAAKPIKKVKHPTTKPVMAVTPTTLKPTKKVTFLEDVTVKPSKKVSHPEVPVKNVTHAVKPTKKVPPAEAPEKNVTPPAKSETAAEEDKKFITPPPFEEVPPFKFDDIVFRSMSDASI